MASWAFCQEKDVSRKYERLKSKDSYHEGFIVNNSNDTIQGLIRLTLGPYGGLSSIWFVEKDGTRLFTEPLEIKSFSYNDLSFITREGSFYFVIYDGRKIDLLRNVTIVYEPGSQRSFFSGQSFSAASKFPKSSVYHINFNGSDEFTLIDRRNFYEILPQLLLSCEPIIQKINEGDYFIYDMEVIARHYDNCD